MSPSEVATAPEENAKKKEISDSSTTSSSTNTPKIKPAPISALFRYADSLSMIVLIIGIIGSIGAAAVLPGINIIFGEVIDSIASPINTDKVMRKAVYGMLILGGVGFATFFVGFFGCAWAAARIANAYRVEYLEAVLRQDASFFDGEERGSIALNLSEAAFDVQSGLGDKFAGAIQGGFQFLFGFAVAFYFGPFLSLVLLSCMPLIILITYLMTTYGSEDGIFGKAAYEKANSIANETLSNMRTIMSLNAETKRSDRYDSKLEAAKAAAVRQGSGLAFLTGSLFFVMFCMYGFGFWFGGKLIADSTDDAIQDHPAPSDLLNGDPESPWAVHYDTIQIACSKFTGEALEVCACGLPWDSMDLTSPNCGCGYDSGSGVDADGDSFSVFSECFTGGKTMLVFFSILLGGFGAGMIGPGVKAFATARLSAAKMLRVIERRPDIDITATPENSNKKSLKRDDVVGEIRFDNVCFSYAPKSSDGDDSLEEGGRAVFGGCNLTIKAGQTVALVGESGCGKSTIAKLVQRFYDPTSGSILLDNTDLCDIALRDLRANIGVVSQEPLLFDTTIMDNIRYGKPDATEEEVQQAAKSANAHDFIMSFPDGYQTTVGPKGGKLSGGQKQRVAIARAIVRNPPILILDEATSALDNRSEAVVQAALDDLVQAKDSKRTTIVIAHRLSTVRNADKIVVLGSKEGTSTVATGSVILEEGSHEELMNIDGGFYRALVAAGDRSLEDHKKERMSMSTSMTNLVEAENNVKKDDQFQDEEGQQMKKTGDEEEGEDGGGSGLFGKLFGSKDDAKKAKEKQEKAEFKKQKARLWDYTRPDMKWIIFGSISSMIKGSIFPLISIVFSEMIVTWYDSDTDEIRDGSLRWSYLFYVLAFLSLTTETIQKGVFEMVGERLTQRLRSDLFRAMLRQDITWFEDDDNGLGILTTRLSTDVKLVRLVTGQSIAATIETCSALSVGIIISLLASWEIFLIMLAMVPLLGITEALQWKALQGSEGNIKESLSQSTNKLNETVNNIREVQSFALEHIVTTDIKHIIKETIQPASRSAALAKGIMMGMIQLIQFSVYAFAFWFGGQMIELDRINFDDFNRALWGMAFAASGLGQAAIFAGDATKAALAVKSISKILDHFSSIDSKPWENGGVADGATRKAIVRKLSEEVMVDGGAELESVNFAYPTRKSAKVFNRINLTIPAGQTVALVGGSGSGKSTVVQLLERFYDPISYKESSDGKEFTIEIVIDDGNNGADNGVVKVDDKNMKTSDCRWIRENIGLVGQEPVLFDDTIYENIALGKDGCTRKDVEEAAKSANAYDFIMGLPDQFDSSVGNAGSKVSGGQKQRIAIARALVGNPKILLLDEATSALDNESEKIVQASLDDLVKESKGDRTTIVIAHRLSTIKGADVICVLDNDGEGSKVVETGTHDELMELGNKYKSLVEAYSK